MRGYFAIFETMILEALKVLGVMLGIAFFLFGLPFAFLMYWFRYRKAWKAEKEAEEKEISTTYINKEGDLIQDHGAYGIKWPSVIE